MKVFIHERKKLLGILLQNSCWMHPSGLKAISKIIGIIRRLSVSKRISNQAEVSSSTEELVWEELFLLRRI